MLQPQLYSTQDTLNTRYWYWSSTGQLWILKFMREFSTCMLTKENYIFYKYLFMSSVTIIKIQCDEWI